LRYELPSVEEIEGPAPLATPFPIVLSFALFVLVLVCFFIGVVFGYAGLEFAKGFLRGLGVPASAAPVGHGTPGSFSDSIIVGCGELGGAAVVLSLLPYLARKSLRALGYVWPSFGAIGFAAIAALATLAFEIAYGFARAALHQKPHVQAGFESYGFQSMTDAIFGVTTSCVVAPFAEETIFRGFLFNALAARVRLPFAYVLGAAAFAAMHLDLVIAPELVASGLVLTFVYRRTGSIYASMITHGLGNAAFVIPYVLKMHAKHAH
jgi:membrane protease YdiL (CAAX protease family)